MTIYTIVLVFSSDLHSDTDDVVNTGDDRL